MLTNYTKHFLTVEINNSFYQLPQRNTLIQWRDTVPQGFIFAVKANRYITHMKKLNDPQKSVSTFLRRMRVLKDRLGPILFQLPPRWACNHERLHAFLAALPEGYKYTFEFRDPSWFNEETYRILKTYNAAFCMYDLNQKLSPKEVSADFIYVRLHGPNGPYKGQYSTRVLTGWVGAFSAWVKKTKDIYCFFDNDQKGYAANDALKLQRMVKQDGH